MKGVFALVCLLAMQFGFAASEGAMGVIQRLVGPEMAKKILIKYEESPTTSAIDYYEFSASGGKISILASTQVAACRGFYDYLKNACGTQLSSATDTVKLPATWPDYARSGKISPATIRLLDTRSTENMFWHWSRWEKTIDWMVLHGFNMILSDTGEVALREELIKQANLGPERHQRYHYPQSWIDGQRDVQVKMFEREKELGIQCLATASREVGVGIADEMTEETISILRKLDKTIQFYFLGDAFKRPNVIVSEFPQRMKRTFDSLYKADPNATFIVTSEVLSEWKAEEVAAFMAGFPDERLIVLDSHNSWQKFPSIANKGWILNPTYDTDLNAYGENVWAALRSERQGYFRGLAVGSQRPIVREWMSDLMWSNSKLSSSQWLSSWLERRYGAISPKLAMAWESYLRILQKLPATPMWMEDPAKLAPNPSYHTETELRAFVKVMVDDSAKHKGNSLFLQDLATVAQSWISAIADSSLFRTRLNPESKKLQGELLEQLSELGQIGASLPDQKFTERIIEAKSWGKDAKERVVLEALARQEAVYGLADTFHREKWAVFFKSMSKPDQLDMISRWESSWMSSTDPIREPKLVDVLSLVRKLLKKYPASL